jgi:hypothetical protein
LNLFACKSFWAAKQLSTSASSRALLVTGISGSGRIVIDFLLFFKVVGCQNRPYQLDD